MTVKVGSHYVIHPSELPLPYTPIQVVLCLWVLESLMQQLQHKVATAAGRKTQSRNRVPNWTENSLLPVLGHGLKCIKFVSGRRKERQNFLNYLAAQVLLLMCHPIQKEPTEIFDNSSKSEANQICFRNFRKSEKIS